MSDSKERPAFTGLNWHRDEHCSFFRPIDWHRFDWQDDRQGVLFGPSPDDDATLFGVDVKEIGFEISELDLFDVLTGVVSGIEQLPEYHIESQEQWVAGVVSAVETKYTFRERDAIRKRWVRVLYQDTRQITVTAQGATVEIFDYWLPMFYEAMMTFKIHPAGAVPTISDMVDSV